MSAASYLATIERLKGNRRAIRGVAPWAVAAGALALAGVIAAAWVTAALVGRSQVARADSRLESEGRSAQAAFATEIVRADAAAGAVAASRAVQRALVRGDEAALRRLTRRRGVGVYRGNRLLAGAVPPGSVTRTVIVSAGGKALGRVVGYVALDTSLLRRLAGAAGINGADQLLLTRRPIAAGKHLGRVSDRRIEGVRYRAFALELVGAPRPVVLDVVTRRAAIGRDARSRIAWALIAAILTLATIFLAVYGLISTRRSRTSRVLEPSDMRALSLVGDALASTHNPERLLPVVLHAAMQATGAEAGRIVSDGEEAIGRDISGAGGGESRPGGGYPCNWLTSQSTARDGPSADPAGRIRSLSRHGLPPHRRADRLPAPVPRARPRRRAPGRGAL